MPQEWKPLKSGAAQEFEQARNGVLIRDAHIGELERILRRVMILVGVRAANLPNEPETSVLTAFIQKKYKGLTISEIQLAFEKAVAGELECEANCYENFSCAYFGGIMAAYKKWAAFKATEVGLHTDRRELPVSKPENNYGLCEAYYQDYLKGKLNFEVMPAFIYDEFVKAGKETNGKIGLSEDAWEDYFERGRDHLKMLYTDLKNAAEKNGNRAEYHEWGQKLVLLTTGQLQYKEEETAKKLAVLFLYGEANKMNYKNLFTNEK